MCPKNMLILKSGKGDQICQTCLDLHHLHTIYRNFPGEAPFVSWAFRALEYASLRSAYVALKLFHFPKVALLKKHLVTPPPWYICYILQRKNTFINFFFGGGVI